MIYRLWIAMLAVGRRIENNASIEFGDDFLLPVAHSFIPQFKTAAVFLLPVLVQVDQHVYPALKIHHDVMIEIGMDRQVTTLLDLMNSRPQKIGIGNQPLDTRNIFHDLDERLGIKRIKKAP